MKEEYYLCRVPWSGMVVVYRENDYSYQRLRERQLYEPNEANNLILLAQGPEKRMRMYRELMKQTKGT